MEKPKYQRLKDYIIETIKSKQLRPGDRVFSENQLAENFGISRHTVRHAISELASEGWLYRQQGRGTFVYRSPGSAADSLKTVGVITTYINDYIFPSIIQGIDRVLSENGYNLMLSCTYNQHEKERLCLENLKDRNIAGLIAEPTKSALPNPNLDMYRELSSIGVPILFIHGFYRELESSYIVEDDVLAGYIATKHLIDLGHEKIGGIFKIDDIQGHYRYAGFQKAQLEAGFRLKDSRVLWFDTEDMDSKFINGGLCKLSDLMSECTALVCYNEQVAVKIMDAARERNMEIPKDFSLVSFDDSQLAIASEVKLTTVAHPKEKLGEEAAKAIIDMITKRRLHFNVKMEPELIIRGSTGKCATLR